jgi:hypothetical protein
MKSVIASLIAIAGVSVAAHGQAQMKMLVSADGGANWSSNIDVLPGTHVDVLVTGSYTGTSTSISGFGSTIFQPIVSNWDNTGSGASIDHLSPILQGGNVLGDMVHAQANSAGIGSPNPYAAYPTPGVNGGAPVPAAPYSTGSYGRVYPMGRAYFNGANAFVGFLHTNPPADQLGRTYAPATYLRIAQAAYPDWFNSSTNGLGGGGVNIAQLYVFGRAESLPANLPDYWGNTDLTLDPGDPANGIPPSFAAQARNPDHDIRRQNVQLFRFGIDLSTDGAPRSLLVDAPIAGQQTFNGTLRYIGVYTNDPAQIIPGLQIPFGTGATQASVLAGHINVVPSPASLIVLGLGAALVRRRPRGPSC